MNRKTAYLIPAFAAVFALMFTVAPSIAMAEYDGEGMHDKGMGQKDRKMHKVIEVAGFTGSIEITEDVDREELKEQVTVKLSEAAAAAEAAGLDVKKGKIGIVANESGNQYLAWTLIDKEKDLESETATITIYVVDAINSSNTATFTEEIDFSERDGKTSYNGDSTNSNRV